MKSGILWIFIIIVLPIFFIDDFAVKMKIYDCMHFDTYEVKERGVIDKRGYCKICGKRQFYYDYYHSPSRQPLIVYRECEHKYIWDGPDDWYIVKRHGKYTTIHHSTRYNTVEIQGIDSVWTNIKTFSCQDFIDKNKNFIIKNAAWGREYTWGKSDGVWYVKSY